MNLNDIEHKIFDIQSDLEFENLALRIFEYQYQNCTIYNQYCNLLNIELNAINKIEKIPFLPIQFFKTQTVKSGNFKKEMVFSSSGTTGNNTSKHYIKDLTLYEKSFFTTFNYFYPNWRKNAIIGLLPSYLERDDSSLIYMVQSLIQRSENIDSKFQLNLTTEFIKYLECDPNPKIVFGVTFALLQMAEKNIKLRNSIVIETGGMKGRGKELTREDLHHVLKQTLQPKAIHSEYGMTELLSQAYYQKDVFKTPPWLKALVREPNDPLTSYKSGKGALNLIDLANLHSCSFVATDDLGTVTEKKGFTVSGRIDHAQIRGCNLLVL